MAAVAYELWSDYQYSPGQYERRSWDVPLATSGEDAVNTPEIPKVGATSLLNRFLEVQDGGITVRKVSFQTYRVSVEFRKLDTSVNFLPGGSGNSGDPLSEPALVDWKIGITSEQVDIDADGNPLVNAVGDAIQPPPTQDFYTMHLQVSRNESVYNLIKAGQFMNRVNSNEVVLFGSFGKIVVPARCFLCKTIVPTAAYRVDAKYINVGYAFELRMDQWGSVRDSFDWRFLNQGTRGYYADPTTSAPKMGHFYAGSERVSDAIPLQPNGKPISDFSSVKVTQGAHSPGIYPYSIKGATFEKAGQSNAYFIRYKKHKEVDFRGLGL
jgi:hypothetical protein